MTKVLLVLDKPRTCFDCPCFTNKFFYCSAKNRKVHTPFEIHDWCPLKPVPERMESQLKEEYNIGYVGGWNDCVDVLGEENDNR